MGAVEGVLRGILMRFGGGSDGDFDVCADGGATRWRCPCCLCSFTGRPICATV